MKNYLQQHILRFHFCMLLIFSVSVVPFQVFSQTQFSKVFSTRETNAELAFTAFRYLEAIDAYTPIVKNDSNNIRALKNLATSYCKVNDFVNAEKVYSRLVVLDTVTADNFLHYAQSLSVNKKYDKAAHNYARYSKLKSFDSRGQAFINAYGKLPDFYRDSNNIHIQLLNINSGQSDFSPAYYKRGLIFCSNRNEGQIVKRVFEWNQSAFLDLYYVNDTSRIKTAKEATDSTINYQKRKQLTNDDDTYTTSNDSKTAGYTNFNYKDTSGMFTKQEGNVTRFSKTLLTKYHEGPLAFFSNQDSLILTRNNYNDGKYKQSTDGVNKLKLYSASYKNNDSTWKNIKPLPFNNDNYSTGHPTIAAGDSVLYFISDMPGGLGGTDIYRSYYRSGNWSTPENVGAPINTEGNEMFPFVDKENTLYFASDGHPGLGGLDLFKTSLSKTGIITNLGYPANSSFDDFGMIFNPRTNTGFFSSNRRRGSGDDDIYRITIGASPFFVHVVDGITNKLISKSRIDLTQLNATSKPGFDSSDNGQFLVGFTNRLTYKVSGYAEGYAPNNIEVTASEETPITIIPLYKPGCIVAGTITDKDTKLPVEGARITIYDVTAQDTVFDFRVEANGKYRYMGLQADHTYSMDVSKVRYFNKPASSLSTAGNKCIAIVEREYDYLKDFELEQIVLGRAIKIENIYFDLAKYNIRPSAAKELDKLVVLMQENPDIIIELSSHTDCRAPYQYNMTLSDNRANASADYIVSKGINVVRVNGIGYGETKLVNDCGCEGKVVTRVCTEEEHQANRRTEFKVTGFLSDKNATMLNNGKGEVPTSVPVGK
ncbi:MAG: OmpA family protein [Bacteroidota bacterium]